MKPAPRWMACFLGLVLLLAWLPLVVPAPAATLATCKDELEDRVYTDCPPEELLQGRSLPERSQLLREWQRLDAGTKKAYADYLTCKAALTEAQRRLAEAEQSLSGATVEHQNAVLVLKQLLLKLLARLGLQTTVVAVDATTDLYLAGRSIAQSIEESGARRNEGGDPAATAQAEEAVKRAARSKAAIDRLSRELSQAELARDIAKAERDLARGRAGVVGPPRTGRYGTQPLGENWLEKDRIYGVKYLSPLELDGVRLHVQDGKFFARDPRTGALKPFHTEHFPSGRAIFVMDEHGNFYAMSEAQFRKANGSLERLQHSSFLSGNPVASAGEMMVDNGTPVLMNRRSGHYQPDLPHLQQAIDEMKVKGVDTSRLQIPPGGLESRPLFWHEVVP